MKYQVRFPPLLALLLIACLGQPVAGAIVFTDNFDTPAFPTGVSLLSYPYWSRLATTPTAVPGIGYNPLGLPGRYGWFVGGAGVAHMSPTTGQMGSENDAWIDLSALGPGSIEAAIVGPFIPGRKYTLSFMTNAISPGNTIAVEISNGYGVPGFTPSVIRTDVATPTASPQPMGAVTWQLHATTFTADFTRNVVIKFASQGPAADGAFLDEVLIEENLPEPAPWMLAGAGLLALGFLRSRFRRLSAPPDEA